MKDRIGQEITVGARVAWGAGGRRTHGLRIGKVKELKPAVDGKAYSQDEVVVQSTEAHGRGGAMRPDQVVVIPE